MALVPDAKREVRALCADLLVVPVCRANRAAGSMSDGRNATWNIWRGGPASGEAAVYAAKARCGWRRFR